MSDKSVVLKKVKIRLFLLIIILLMFSNCAMYYFSAKTLEPGKWDIGAGMDGGYQFNRELESNSGFFYDRGPYESPMFYFYTRVGLPKEFNISLSLGNFWYIPWGLTAGLSKKIYTDELKKTDYSLEAGRIALLETMGDHVWGWYLACNNYTKVGNIGYSFKAIFESQKIYYINQYAGRTCNYDKRTLIFLGMIEIPVWGGFNILPYASILAGKDLYKPDEIYYGGQIGISFFFRTH